MQKLLLTSLTVAAMIFVLASAYAAEEENLDTDTMKGICLRPIEYAGKDYLIVDIPFDQCHIPIPENGKKLALTFGLNLLWGVQGGFSLDTTVSLGLRYSPVKYFSIYSEGQAGTFFGNNYSLMYAAGFDFDIPVWEKRDLTIGLEYFDRRMHQWAGFMEEEQWYVSGDGVALRIGLRFRLK